MFQYSLSRYSFFVIICCIIILISCAEIQTPPGGIPDKTSPHMVNSIPKSGETGVIEQKRIIIQFSEPIQQGTGQQVFVSPRPDHQPKVKIRGDKLEINLQDSLKPDQTYTIQVNTSLSDLRGNKIDSSIIIAFSTGNSIDSGAMSGSVIMNNTPQSGAIVALYALNKLSDTILYDSLDPDYVSISNQKGFFQFRYLPNQEFRLLAFLDKNRDYRLNPKTEPFAIPDRPVVIGGDYSLDSIRLDVVTIDTSQPQIISALFTQNGLIKTRLSREMNINYLKAHLNSTALIDSQNTINQFPLVAFPEMDDSTASTLNFWFNPVPEAMYSLHMTYDSIKLPIIYKPIQVRNINDKEPPVIIKWQPGEKPLFINNIKIGFTFTEPVDTTSFSDSTITLLENERDTIRVTRTWRDLFHVDIHPNKLKPGMKYRISIKGNDIYDLRGNRIPDSLKMYKFTTLSEDSLGSVTGQVFNKIKGKEQLPVVLTFREVKLNSLYRLAVPSRDFQIDIPAGKYILSGIIDENGNNVCDPGSLRPFHLSETQAIYSDTVAVRARFETAGIKFEIK